jgi:hypothetical protein
VGQWKPAALMANVDWIDGQHWQSWIRIYRRSTASKRYENNPYADGSVDHDLVLPKNQPNGNCRLQLHLRQAKQAL